MPRFARLDVVHRDGLNGDARHSRALADGHDGRVGQLRLAYRWAHDDSAWSAQLLNLRDVQVVTVVVGHQDQIGRLRTRIVTLAPGIYLNDLARVLDLHARMNDRRDLDVAAVRFERVGARRCTCQQGDNGECGAQ